VIQAYGVPGEVYAHMSPLIMASPRPMETTR